MLTWIGVALLVAWLAYGLWRALRFERLAVVDRFGVADNAQHFRIRGETLDASSFTLNRADLLQVEYGHRVEQTSDRRLVAGVIVGPFVFGNPGSFTNVTNSVVRFTLKTGSMLIIETDAHGGRAIAKWAEAR